MNPLNNLMRWYETPGRSSLMEESYGCFLSLFFRILDHSYRPLHKPHMLMRLQSRLIFHIREAKQEIQYL